MKQSNTAKTILRESEINRIVVKSSDSFLQRIVNKSNNFDVDIVQAAMSELESRKVTV